MRTAGAGEGWGTPSVRGGYWGCRGRWRWRALQRVRAAAPVVAPVFQPLPPRLGRLSTACRVRATQPLQRRTCVSVRSRERGSPAPSATPLPGRAPPPPRRRGERREAEPITRASMKERHSAALPRPRRTRGCSGTTQRPVSAGRLRLSSLSRSFGTWQTWKPRGLSRVLEDPRTIGMGRGAGAGPADTCAASGPSAQPLSFFLGILFISHFLIRTDTKVASCDRDGYCQY